MRRDRQLGFRIEEFLELQQWKVMALGPDVPRAQAPDCPADGTPLRTLVTFCDDAGRLPVRLGCCPDCGHIAYIDRPDRTWIDRYYLETWDAHDVDDRVDRRTQKMLVKAPKEKTVVKLVKALPIDRARSVCEIGCGFGGSLLHLSQAGFTNMIGTDASKHRAESVRELLQIPVLTAPFESDAAQGELAARAPFGAIVSNHVLEHTYAPDQVFAAAAALQGPGDYFVLAVPNQEREPVMAVLMFLPHLHSFTRASMQTLAARHGYAVVDDRYVVPKQLVFVFQKTTVTPAAVEVAPGVFDRAVERFARALHLDRRHVGRRRFWWKKRSGEVGQRWMFGRGGFEARRWQQEVARKEYGETRSLAVTNLRRRHTSVGESPFEIQFRGPVSLFYK